MLGWGYIQYRALAQHGQALDCPGTSEGRSGEGCFYPKPSYMAPEPVLLRRKRVGCWVRDE